MTSCSDRREIKLWTGDQVVASYNVKQRGDE